VISELGRRLAANLEPSPRERVDAREPRSPGTTSDFRTDSAPDGPPGRGAAGSGADADFALSLSSASLRLAEDQREPAATTPDLDPEVPTSPTPSNAVASASPAPGPTEPARRSPTNRVIEAYREIARAPVGEHVRIVA
jgi:hypothetical protein